MLNDFLATLQNTPLAAAMRGDVGSVWLFPTVETIHVMAIATVVGSIVMVDLRLLGVSSRNSSVLTLSAEILPVTWIAFLIAALAGTAMFVSKAHTYFHNSMFQLKFVCMFLAGVNMLAFHLGAYRKVLEWDSKLPPPLPARLAGVLSLMLWIGVVAFGRWVGFTT